MLKLDADAIGAADPAVMRDLQKCCALCTSKALCRRELADEPHSEHWRNYCPNSDTLAALTRGATR